jgi:acetoin utilization deacetylase AcuC-like enzyme
LWRVEPEPVGDDLIATVHTERLINMLHWIEQQNEDVWFDGDTYTVPGSVEIARLAAGGVVRAVDAVLKGEAANGLAAVRPPGHHALAGRGMGFCILGNVPIAARFAQQQHGLSRVMIVDYDVHHGNGTQDMFFEDDSVLFISSHQSPFYPGSGLIHEIGAGRGKGYTLNIPLQGGHGDASYAALYRDVIWPAARRFKPELILVSAGFDAHWTDPLAMMRLSLTGYAHLTRELIGMAEELCGGKIVFALEGGYNLEALAHGVRNIAHALLGQDEISDPLGARSGQEPDVAPLIDRLRQIHSLP